MVLLFLGLFAFIFNIQSVKATGTIFIRADGSIDPPTAPILRVDNVTYAFTDNNYDSIVVERSNIIIDGAGYTLQGAGDTGSRGIDLTGRTNVTVRNAHINNFGYGIWLYSSSDNSISGNNITNNSNVGIELTSSTYNSISGNNITNSDIGILLYTSSNYGSISGNNITNNYYGIEAHVSDSISISGNNITNNYAGVKVEYSWFSSISGNNIAANSWAGIEVYISRSNSISRNNITANNAYGIELIEAYTNSFSGNNITNNYQGIRLSQSSNNRFYHNSLFNNNIQVFSVPESANTWDDSYPSGGNFWSDYAGADLDHDGVGDSAYVIDVSNQDNYPLMKPYTSPHDIGIISLSVSKTVIAQNVSALIRFEVINYGTDPETFNVAAYANQSSIFGLTISPVPGRHSVVFVFGWFTTSFAIGNYTITAHAGPVYGETDLSDNKRAISPVKITIPGDINGDFFVNIKDASQIGIYWQQNSPPAPANVDINGDGKITIMDATIIGVNWQKHT